MIALLAICYLREREGAALEETVTLYLGLKEGRKADFEVVGLAAAAFAEAVKEISYILEPGLDVRLEFDSGTEGSLKLKAIIRTLKTPAARKNALLSIVGTIALVLTTDTRGYTYGKLLDLFFATEQRKELSDEDIARIAKHVIDINKGKIAKAPMQQMYKQLERDKNIESVGAITSRTITSTERLTLISPVLLPADRVWRFRSPIGEYSYFVKDEKFLNDVLNGKLHLNLKQGIQITATIDTKEEFEGGVWVPKRREIIKVVRIHKKTEPDDLFAPPKKSKKSAKKGRKTN